MRGLVYEFSVLKYLAAKAYFSIFRRGRGFFPGLKFHHNLALPKLHNDRWVRVRTLLCGICGSDQNMLKGQESFSMEPYASFPFVPGHENVGEIVSVGNSVAGLKIGDRVVVNPVMSCAVHDRKLCTSCAAGHNSLCENFGDQSTLLGAGLSLGYHKSTGGGWSEFFVAHESQVHKISQDIPLKRAVLVDPLCAALQAVGSLASGKNEEKSVVIFGMGAIGLLCVVAIRALKLPWKIIAVYRHEFQAELSRKMGADLILKSDKNLIDSFCNVSGAIRRNISLGKPVLEGGVDAVLDCIASAETLDLSLRFAKTKGQVMMLGTGTDLSKVDPTPLWFREVTLSGSSMSRVIIDPRDGNRKSCYSLAVELLPMLNLESLVSHEFELADYRNALSTAMNKKGQKVVKVVFNPSKGK